MQELIKQLVVSVADAGLTNQVYFGFHVMDFISVFILAIILGPKLKIGSLKAILIVLIVYPIIYVWMLVQFWIESGFTIFGGQHLVSMFIWIPLAGILAAKILKIEWNTVCYFMAPAITLIQTVGHLGCIFSGCCNGYEVGWGLYNIRSGGYHFPIQPIESLIALTIVAILLIKAKRENYVPDEKQYPIMMIMYGSTRFICEFLRDNNKLIWGWSKLAFHALFMVLVAVIALIVIDRKKKGKSLRAVKNSVSES